MIEGRRRRLWWPQDELWLGMFKFVLGRFRKDNLVGNNISRLGVFGVWLGRLMAWFITCQETPHYTTVDVG